MNHDSSESLVELDWSSEVCEQSKEHFQGKMERLMNKVNSEYVDVWNASDP